MTAILTIYSLVAAGLAVSLFKDRQKTKKAFVIAGKGLRKSAPSLMVMLGVVGLILGLLTPQKISSLIGAEAGFTATVTAAVIGALTLIPSLVAFPLAGSLLRASATVMTISAFITTLVMVGVVTAPMEMKVLGRRFTLLRNGLGFISALLIAAVMGMIL
jgi:uncharacterized membrane protein YraQ (UPF0718 family)